MRCRIGNWSNQINKINIVADSSCRAGVILMGGFREGGGGEGDNGMLIKISRANFKPWIPPYDRT